MAEALDVPFSDISSELWRAYRFPGGEIVRIDAPVRLAVSASGGHRVESIDGHGHYVPSGWLKIEWKPREGQPVFVR